MKNVRVSADINGLRAFDNWYSASDGRNKTGRTRFSVYLYDLSNLGRHYGQNVERSFRLSFIQKTIHIASVHCGVKYVVCGEYHSTLRNVAFLQVKIITIKQYPMRRKLRLIIPLFEGVVL